MYPGDIAKGISAGMQPTVNALAKIAQAIEANTKAIEESRKAAHGNIPNKA